jgi:hypothetical protein
MVRVMGRTLAGFRVRFLLLAAAACSGKTGAQAQSSNMQREDSSMLFNVARAKPDRAVITLGEELPEGWPAAGANKTAMLRRIEGVLGDLRGAALVPLRVTLPQNPLLGDAGGAERICTIRLFAGEQSKRLSLVRTAAGEFIAIEVVDAGGSAQPRRAQLKREEFAALWNSLDPYRGALAKSGEEAVGVTFDLAPPLAPARYRCDKAFLGERFNGGHDWTIDASKRVLAESSFVVRLPKGYDPASLAGLLVWVSPTESGSPPRAWDEALDALGIVAIGANDSGNTRHITDRLQMALDAAQTARERYHIDARRIYVAGFSGGGRTSSMLWACVPDVFAGCVPLGGLSCYEPVPNGLGSFWPRGYEKPAERLWTMARGHRIAPITGSKDFNQREVENATAILERARMPIKLWDVPGLSHEIPASATLREALDWIDEPYRTLRAREEEEAGKLVATARKRGALDDSGRGLLRKATEIGPWTHAAWEASELLKGDLSAKAASPAEGR